MTFGIGATEVIHVLATQSLVQRKPRRMRVDFDGTAAPGVTPKDLILALIGQIGTAVADVRRAEHLDSTKLVLITDAAGLDTAAVQRGLALMDANRGEVWAKLDAGTERYYRAVNRTAVRFEPGQSRDVQLVALAGSRTIYGFRGDVMGKL